MKFSLPVILILLVFSCGAIAQCTLTIPAVSTTSDYNYCGSTVYNVPKTTEAYYATHYNWVCPGDTVDFVTASDGNQQCCGAVILDSGAVFILEYGAAGWTVWAKGGSSFINNGSVNGNNSVIYEPGAYITPGFSTGNSPGGYCTVAYNDSCAHLIYDYSLIVNGTGCQVSLPAPAPKFGASEVNLCAGSSVTFTDSSTGSPTGWKWTFQGGTPDTSSSQNPVITYNSEGTFDVTLIVTNASGSDTLTKTGFITVTAMPVSGTISANPDTLCSGDSAILMLKGSTGSIQWQSSTGGNFSSIQNAVDTFYNTSPLSQNTQFRIIASNGICVDTSAPVQVTVNPLPTPPVISAIDSIFCPGDSTLITSTGTYSSYKWNTGDTDSFVYANAAGRYWVTVADENGCSATSNRLNVSTYLSPAISVVVYGDTLSSYGEASYQWFYNGNLIPGATDSVYVVFCDTMRGYLEVLGTDVNGCKTLSNPIYSYELCYEGVNSISKINALNIYPDPFANSLFIREVDVLQNITIYDVFGRTVFNRDYSNSLYPLLELDVSTLLPGVYFVKINSSEGEFVRPVIKQ